MAIVGTPGVVDVLVGTPEDDEFGFVPDTVWGEKASARNTLTGERVSIAGKNRAFDLFDGLEGNDRLVATAGADAVVLTTTGSALFPSAAHLVSIEVFELGEGDDVLDLVAGPQGSASYTTAVDASGGRGRDVLWSGSGDDVLRGEAGADRLSGGYGIDNLSGGTGNDTLRGGPGDDLLLGEAGNDILRGGADADFLNGDTGNDLFVWSTGDGRDIYNAGQGTDVILVRDSLFDGLPTVFDEGSSIEAIEPGEDFDLVLVGSDERDEWRFTDIAMARVATIRVGLGDDFVVGSSGDDQIEGEGGADELYGGLGDDVLDPGTDDLLGDTLAGEDGSDRFVFRGTFGSDTILDFASGEDRIDMNGTGVTFDQIVGRATDDDFATTVDLTDLGLGAIVLQGVAAVDLNAADFIL